MLTAAAIRGTGIQERSQVSSKVEIHVVDSISEVEAAGWNSLADGNPFVLQRFLSSMHDAGCASRTLVCNSAIH
jgi:hypothetical protein